MILMKLKINKRIVGIALAGAVLAGGVYSFHGLIGRTISTVWANITGQATAALHESEGAYIRQIVASDNSKSRTIMWQSEISEPNAIVEYRKVDTTEISTVNASNRVFTDDKETNYIHEATLTGLTQSTTYEYRVGYDQKRSTWFTLKTAGVDNYEVLIYPDSQSANYSGWFQLVKDSYNRNPNSDLYISMGDLVDNGEQASQWRAWFRSVSPLSATVPLSPLMGNHETYTLDWKIREPLAYINYFTLPSNGNDTFKNRYYSYDFGDVHYVVLDTQFKEAKDFHPELEQEEIAWLRQDLQSNHTRWTIVLMHKDSLRYKTNKFDGTSGFNEIGEAFMPIFDEFNVDLVLSAHYHTYRNRGHIRNFERDATGPLYILTGVAGDVRYQNLWIDHPLDVVVAPQPETDNYMTMDVTHDQIRIKSFLPNGEKIDEIVVNKD